MFAVIFKAEINHLDESYAKLAERMRELAKAKYGCREFISVTEGSQELAVAYWDSQEQIEAWKQDPEHRVAQQIGRKVWYRSYQIQVAEIVGEYKSNQGPGVRWTFPSTLGEDCHECVQFD